MLFMTAAIRRYRRLVWTTSAGAWIAGWLLAAPAAAQWRNLPTDSVPLGADGKPNMSAPTPRTPDGKPDLSGIYTPNMRYFQNLAADLGLENVPMTAEARKIHAARAPACSATKSPTRTACRKACRRSTWRRCRSRSCRPTSWSSSSTKRSTCGGRCHLDGRELADDLNPSWMGYSKGRWEGDALVVETRGLNGKQWLDHGGLPASDKLTVIERFRRPTSDALEIELTITDPTYYTKPWTATTNARLMPDTELFEFICNENEKSTPHMGPHIK